MSSTQGVKAQEAYADRLAKTNFPFTLAVGAAFVRGMREVGYRNTATALCELIDNAEQAEAQQVHVVFGYESGDRKPTKIAIIDDGHGMSPRMLRAAVLWGGTHREDDRDGFGRFGYGLPSSCVSQGRAFHVYSKRRQQAWHQVAIDLDEIAQGLFTTETGHIVVPEPERAELPDFVSEYLAKRGDWGKLKSGTVIVIDKLDRIDRKTSSKLIELLVTHFGVTYHKIIGRCRIYVDGKPVEPTDPLFLTPGHRWYDLDSDRALPLEPINLKVKKSGDRPGGEVRVRLSYLPYTFQAIDKERRGRSSANLNGRFYIMRDYNGVVICRNGRVIECKSATPWTRFQNNDRHVRLELDFSASLDDEFRINTSKQRVDLSDRMWDLLRQGGLEQAIKQIRRLYIEDKIESESMAGTGQDARSSAERILERLHRGDSPDDLPLDATTIDQLAKSTARDSGVSVDEAYNQLRLKLNDKLYKVGQRANPGGSFFEIEQVGPQRILWLNTSHLWYRSLYTRGDVTPHARRVLELTLFTLGDRLLDTRSEAHQMLSYELAEWSRRLESALTDFDQHFADPDVALDDEIASASK